MIDLDIDALEVYPTTIFQARYGSIYEGGLWVAVWAYPENVPPDATGDDVACMVWWGLNFATVGVGSSPNEALSDLYFKKKDGTAVEYVRGAGK